MKPKTLLLTLALGLPLAVCLAGDTKTEQALRDADDTWFEGRGQQRLGENSRVLL